MLDKDALAQLRQLKQQIEAQKISATGTVRGSQGRFGFVVLDDGREIYLPPEQMLRVFPDDRVEIEIVSGDDGKQNAIIEKVVSSPLREFTGQYVVRDNAHFVEPDLPRLSRWIFVPPKQRGNAQHGDYVRARISRHPFIDSKPQAHVEQIIGNDAVRGIETTYALARHQLQNAPLALIENDLAKPDEQQRRDLTALPFVTIDGAETRDMDDALHAQAGASGWKLWVAIADPSAWINANSALEQAIAARATSVYLPGLTVAMLPEELANERCSLQPDVERLALVCEIDINADGVLGAYAFSEARIRSRAKLSYSEVANFLTGKDSPAAAAWGDSLRELQRAALALQQQRQREHILMPERPDYRPLLDADNKISAYLRLEKNCAQQLVEECMIATNRCAADFLQNDDAIFVRHNGFRSERREQVQRLLAEQLPQLQNSDVALLENYVALMQTLAHTENPLPLRAILLRSLERSQFSVRAAPHFGMGLPRYTTITSPIRKFNDFFLHRIIKAKLRGEPLPQLTAQQLEKLQEGSDRARQASNLAEQWLDCQYLQSKHCSQTKTQQQSTNPLRGEIVHVTSSGFVVRLCDSGIEGFVDTRHSGEKFSFDNVYMRLSSATRQFQPEQLVDVAVSTIDMKRRAISFQLAPEQSAVNAATTEAATVNAAAPVSHDAGSE